MSKLNERTLPDYTRGEERFNMISHTVGAVFGIAALCIGVITAAFSADAWAIVGCAVYGASLVILYTMSSLYHGLKPICAKKVFRVLDHCTIFLLIAGTYTPIVLCPLRRASSGTAWMLFGIVWGFAALGIVLNAIDLKKYIRFSLVCYVGMGWSILLAAKTVIRVMPVGSLLFLLGGGIAYTVGAVLYVIGKKHRYIHSVFHVFVLLGSILQFFGVMAGIFS